MGAAGQRKSWEQAPTRTPLIAHRNPLREPQSCLGLTSSPCSGYRFFWYFSAVAPLRRSSVPPRNWVRQEERPYVSATRNERVGS